MKNEDINVLSLFDGMSCGQIALDKIGVNVDKYYASETDKYAIKVTQANYPKTIQLGDVKQWKHWNIDFSKIDLLMAGFPCQDWSIAGKQAGDKGHRGALIYDLIDIWTEIKKKNSNIKFLFENVRMKKEFVAYINGLFGYEPVEIDSALISAQQRKRLYWTNIRGIIQPKDKGVLLQDILEENTKADRNKSLAITASYRKTGNGESHSAQRNYFQKKQGQIVFQNPPYEGKMGFNRTVPIANDKYKTLVSSSGGRKHTISDSKGRWRSLTPEECEALQTVPKGYTDHVSKTRRYQMLGNGWTVDVIAHILTNLFVEEEGAAQFNEDREGQLAF